MEKDREKERKTERECVFNWHVKRIKEGGRHHVIHVTSVENHVQHWLCLITCNSSTNSTTCLISSLTITIVRQCKWKIKGPMIKILELPCNNRLITNYRTRDVGHQDRMNSKSNFILCFDSIIDMYSTRSLIYSSYGFWIVSHVKYVSYVYNHYFYYYHR